MRRDAVLALLTFAGSALCWWPMIIEPSLDVPGRLMLVPVALCTGLASLLSNRRWRFVCASEAGSLAGLVSGFLLWPPSDPIAAPYTPLVIGVASGAALVSSVLGLLLAVLLRRWTERHARAVWIGLLVSVAAGPLLLAATPPVVAYRVARNDRLARERFLLLKDAVEKTIDGNGSGSFCDGEALKKHYAGPAFREEAWRYIAGNYVQQDGYVFGLNCHEGQAAYTLDVLPARGKGDGTLRFCTDQSGVVGCGLQYVDKQSRCFPCAP